MEMSERVAVLEVEVTNIKSSLEEIKELKAELKGIRQEVHNIVKVVSSDKALLYGIAIGVSTIISGIITFLTTGIKDFFKAIF